MLEEKLHGPTKYNYDSRYLVNTKKNYHSKNSLGL